MAQPIQPAGLNLNRKVLDSIESGAFEGCEVGPGKTAYFPLQAADPTVASDRCCTGGRLFAHLPDCGRPSRPALRQTGMRTDNQTIVSDLRD